MNKGLTLRMNQCPVKRQWPRLFEHVRNGYLKPSDIVTHRIPLEHIAEGYHIFSAKLDGCIKPLDRPERGLRTGRPTMAYTPQKPPTRRSRSDAAPRPHPRLGRRPRPEGPARRCPKLQFDPDRDRRALGVPRAAAGEVAARAVDRAQVPHAGVRHALPAEGPVRRDPQVRLRASTARAAPRTGCCCIAADRVDALGEPPALVR